MTDRSDGDANLKYHTKQKRLVAMTDAWMTAHGKPTFSVNEVSAWAETEGLLPVPKRGDPKAFCLAWENRLQDASEPCDRRCNEGAKT